MKCLLCSYFKFPEGDAGAVRHEKLAQMLAALGHEVFVVGLGKNTNFCKKVFKGIDYISLRYPENTFFAKAASRVLYGFHMVKLLKQYAPDVVLTDDLRPFRMFALRKYCVWHGIRLVHDSVEWYSAEQFSHGKWNISYLQKDIVNRCVIREPYRVIAISSFLEEHFKAKNLKCVNIPIVVSDEDLVQEKHLEDVIHLTYAGQPGRKDYLHIMLQALTLLPETVREKFCFHIVGASLEQLVSSGIPETMLRELAPVLRIHGRISRGEVMEILKITDFTVLIRSDEQRYAKAGFPTKAVESLSHSTPLIANVTSDLGRYLRDGYNALIVPSCDAKDLARTFCRAAGLSLQERQNLCENAFQTAANQLQYREFLEDMRQILQ